MSRTALALDLGGTHVSAGRVDLEQARVDEWVRIALPPRAGREELLERITGAAADVAEGVDVVGFAVPGPFDYERGVAWLHHKLEPLFGVDLRGPLATKLGVASNAISFLNDADAFTLGEWWSGAAKGSLRTVGATLGTGIGSAFLAHAEIVNSGPAVPPLGEIYRITYRGAPVEESVSRGALIARYGRPHVDVDAIAQRARDGDAKARNAFDDVAMALGEVFEPWLRSFGATCFVVGGSIAAAWDLLEPGLRSALEGVLEPSAVVRAAHLDDAPLLGAAYHAGSHGGGRDAAAHATPARPRPAARLNAQAEAMRRSRIAAGARPLHELGVAAARAAQAAAVVEPVVGTHAVDALDLDGPVPVRLYRPQSSGALPVCVWMVGGGWVLDTLAVAEAAIRRIAAETPCAVAAIRYRLAPEHRFPTQLGDCVASTRWLLARESELGLDAGRVAVGGTSAGANLAAAFALHARDEGEPRFAAQVLIYPVLLYDPNAVDGFEAGDEVFLSRRDVDWCWAHYLADPADGSSPLASPLRAEDLARLPPALVVTAEADPLRDEAERYARRLQQAGTPVEVVRFDGVPHGFFSLTGVVDAAEDAQQRVIQVLRTWLASAR